MPEHKQKSINKVFKPNETFQRSGNKGHLPTRGQKPGPSKSKNHNSKKD
ncbi:hypothetical protein H5S09_02945 [Limosilactobacillus sp. STM2_1]|uniref:Uncharacterized protein n=1 Tax=Limosilactobacillus rudii TaxID=2759755 RepID=A0A7W3UJV0_9LACO|nr:hypothetical protein [Limosilactobacillus rudii]MBB1078312.1 hypothetical protein [Limosilactobacillus rudii]MBB1096908.1 hypothetical protein [Limosilactobacillus rudii]MCD7134092.1 hypothetical protein [Limosilactobacillus rudii]